MPAGNWLEAEKRKFHPLFLFLLIPHKGREKELGIRGKKRMKNRGDE